MLERLAQALAPVSVWIWAAWTAGTAQIRGAAGPAFAVARLRYRKLEQRERVLVQIAGALVPGVLPGRSIVSDAGTTR